MRNDILFLTLRTFSATGGIEKVCRILGKALYEQSLQSNSKYAVCSMYDVNDDAADNPYFPTENFCGYGIRKLNFIQAMVRKGRDYDTLILSHINLLPIAWLLKKINPKKKIVLLAHGIEIWYPLSKRKRKMLDCCDAIFCVSNYTAATIISEHDLPPQICKVLNNCLDPFMPLPQKNVNTDALRERYGFTKTDKILFKLARLSESEKYKGYDKVIDAIQHLNNPTIKYIIAGKADAGELASLNEKIKKAGLEKQVVLAGFIPEEELANHFYLADLYLMPSTGEGFGVVYLEAMYYGLPVIAGNVDGSVDALDKGRLGTLVDPDDNAKLQKAIEVILQSPENYIPNHLRLLELFSYEQYKFKLNNLLDEVSSFPSLPRMKQSLHSTERIS